MCLIVVALGMSPEVPFVLAANRDEYFARPTAAAAWWEHEGVPLFGGRDLDKGGTWLGVTKHARVAGITNVRDPKASDAGKASRGWLVRDALVSVGMPPHVAGAGYPAFNLLVFEGRELFYLRDDADVVRVAAGFHGLSNHRLDTPWPKVEDALRALEKTRLDDVEALFRILKSDAVAADARLPKTGVPADVERALSPAFVRLPEVAYGTRCSTVIVAHADGALELEERTWDLHGNLAGTVHERVG
jgi:uncharacterized protein with NRDE domain